MLKWLRLRNREVSEKVYIEKEGPYYEYSATAPEVPFDRIWDLLYGSYSGRNFLELFYSLPEVFAPVHEIASRVSDANWTLMKTWNDEVDWNNPFFNKLFLQPNPLLTFKKFIYQSVCYELLTGKEYLYFNNIDIFQEPYKNVVTMWNLPSHKVIAENKEGFDVYTATELSDFIRKYKIGDRIFQTKDVVPVLNPDLCNPNDVNKSLSELTGAEKAIRNLIPVYEARGIIYIKRGALGFIVSRKSDESGMQVLTKKEKKEIVEDFQQTNGVTRGKQPVAISAYPLDFIKTSMSIQEMQPFDETLADAIAIYKTLRVPRHLVPSKDNSTFSNAETDMKSFYTDVIIPMAKRRADVFTNYLKFDRRYVNADFKHISFLQDDLKKKADTDKVNGSVWLERWQNGACSLNEWIVANDGEKGVGSIYDKKIFDLTDEEVIRVKSIINMKTVSKNENTGTADQGAQVQS